VDAVGSAPSGGPRGVARLRCSTCLRAPLEGHGPGDAYEQIYYLGYAKPSRKGPPKRQVIHLVCGRRFWTRHFDVLTLDLYSLKKRAVMPRATRLVDLE
jgi:hypothetical protein